MDMVAILSTDVLPYVNSAKLENVIFLVLQPICGAKNLGFVFINNYNKWSLQLFLAESPGSLSRHKNVVPTL